MVHSPSLDEELLGVRLMICELSRRRGISVSTLAAQFVVFEVPEVEAAFCSNVATISATDEVGAAAVGMDSGSSPSSSSMSSSPVHDAAEGSRSNDGSDGSEASFDGFVASLRSVDTIEPTEAQPSAVLAQAPSSWLQCCVS